ncbi:MAG: hypothetical protein A2W18_09890 [Candidatus Muproteobacteria bacterium RBG_16_60_9]|uniref:HTH araC/xylS-type domain-containing protein n=1 Tax=Candidatus Muproteobacteria bacterium RBG_16_60_9 TaxID=1817755 RepID=A0A1F6VFI1_9PROT|nr:MAG: hypothetical protein A2W18_09890 [Candidatus Muproteobacteria bacterium RBG_16_60_9]
MMSRRTGEYFGLALGAQKILDYACARGANRSVLIERMELGSFLLDNPDARLPTRCYYNLIAAAAETLCDPWFGIHYLESAQPGDIGAVGFVAVSSRTLGEAVARTVRYLSYLTESERVSIETRDEGISVEWRILGRPHPAHALVSEMYAYDFTVLAGRLIGSVIPVKAIYLAHEPLQPEQRYRELFGCHPKFGAERNSCVLEPDVFDTPMPHANDALASFFDRFLAERVLAPTTPLHDRVQREVLTSLCDGEPNLAGVAKRLAMSGRTLQRRLAEEQLSVREIVEDVRRRASMHQLSKNTALGDISYLLGFRDTRSFFRAFKRWTGMTPLAWRAERARRK